MSVNNTSSDYESKFTYLPSRCITDIRTVHDAIEDKVSEISTYMDKWLQFQSLWDLQADQVYEMLGENLARCRGSGDSGCQHR